ncbi:MAG: hypothetical protein IJU07_06455 [Synergistaceae bacterium]|nr:hypothetical protein [Synergistaceae bacterium]
MKKVLTAVIISAVIMTVTGAAFADVRINLNVGRNMAKNVVHPFEEEPPVTPYKPTTDPKLKRQGDYRPSDYEGRPSRPVRPPHEDGTRPSRPTRPPYENGTKPSIPVRPPHEEGVRPSRPPLDESKRPPRPSDYDERYKRNIPAEGVSPR